MARARRFCDAYQTASPGGLAACQLTVARHAMALLLVPSRVSWLGIVTRQGAQPATVIDLPGNDQGRMQRPVEKSNG
jgi:hypothetical protein